jgi:hypothetical protein
MEAVTVANVLTNEMFFRFSPPERLHSDQGRQFEGKLMQEICQILKIRKSRTSPYHPQGDGLVERYKRTLLDMLATSCKSNPNDWERYVRPVCFAYNTSIQASRGYTPHFLMFGREARLPIDLQFGALSPDTLSTDQHVRRLQSALGYAYQLAQERLGEAQERQKALYDRKVHGSPFQTGDLVWLYSPVILSGGNWKLHHPWIGPYRVITRLSNLNYKIQLQSDSSWRPCIVHFNRLKCCKPGTRFEQPSLQQQVTMLGREQHFMMMNQTMSMRKMVGIN